MADFGLVASKIGTGLADIDDDEETERSSDEDALPTSRRTIIINPPFRKCADVASFVTSPAYGVIKRLNDG